MLIAEVFISCFDLLFFVSEYVENENVDDADDDDDDNDDDDDDDDDEVATTLNFLGRDFVAF